MAISMEDRSAAEDRGAPEPGATSSAALAQNAEEVELLPALTRALKAASDPEDQRRLFDLFQAAARAINALGEINLSSFEPTGDEGTDLSAWEEMAPIIGATIADVNGLLATVDERIPAPKDEDDDIEDMDDLFGDCFDDSSARKTEPANEPEKDSAECAKAAMSAVHGIASALRQEVAAFGEAMRKPQVMANRWNLLDILESFRGKFRAGIGEMVFAAASSLAEVKKEEVVPGFREDTERAVKLRQALALLTPAIASENAVAQAAPASDKSTIRDQAERILKLLGDFMKSEIGPTLRAADRQSVSQLSKALAAHITEETVKPVEMQRTMEGLDRFLESMSVINLRETLIIHDREALPRLERTLDLARDAAHAGDDPAARLLLAAGMETGSRVLGREPNLDEVLHRARGLEHTELDGEDIALWADTLLESLRTVTIP